MLFHRSSDYCIPFQRYSNFCELKSYILVALLCPASLAGVLSDDAVWRLSGVCLTTSVAYIGPKSRTQRPRKSKIGIEVAHVTFDSDTTLKVKRSKVKVTMPLSHRRIGAHQAAAAVGVGTCWPWETAATVESTLPSARRRKALRRPRGRREAAGAYRGGRPPTACYYYFLLAIYIGLWNSVCETCGDIGRESQIFRIPVFNAPLRVWSIIVGIFCNAFGHKNWANQIAEIVGWYVQSCQHSHYTRLWRTDIIPISV